jgi:hypothetical protein
VLSALAMVHGSRRVSPAVGVVVGSVSPGEPVGVRGQHHAGHCDVARVRGHAAQQVRFECRAKARSQVLVGGSGMAQCWHRHGLDGCGAHGAAEAKTMDSPRAGT